MWAGFLRRTSLAAGVPSLAVVVSAVAAFALPPLAPIRDGGRLDLDWPPGGPWRRDAGGV